MRILIEDYDGEVPTGFDDLLRLPGVARKTANVVSAERGNAQGDRRRHARAAALAAARVHAAGGSGEDRARPDAARAARGLGAVPAPADLARPARVRRAAAARASAASSPTSARRAGSDRAISVCARYAGPAETDMSLAAARVTHLPPLCDRAYSRSCDVSVTELRQMLCRFVHRDAIVVASPLVPRAGAPSKRDQPWPGRNVGSGGGEAEEQPAVVVVGGEEVALHLLLHAGARAQRELLLELAHAPFAHGLDRGASRRGRAPRRRRGRAGRPR